MLKVKKLTNLYSSYEIFFMLLIMLFGYYIYSTVLHIRDADEVKSSSNKTFILGDGKTITLKNIRPIIPHPAVILHSSDKAWVVKVPLTPFKSPLVTYPKLTVPLPKFLLYKPEYLSPIRNQGDCGACWAFCLCDTLSDIAMVYSGGVYNDSLSVQELLSCFNTDGCDGGSPEEACIWLSNTQKFLYSEKKYPYKQTSGEIVSTKCPVNESGFKIQVKKNSTKSIVKFVEENDISDSALSIIKNNVMNMKKALFFNGPFFCAMTVYNDLFSYTGLTPYKPQTGANKIGGHGIEIVGYCDEGEDSRYNTGYWICRNSWGNKWPTNSTIKGYFMVEMNKNTCGIESRCGYAIPMIYAPASKKKRVSLEKLRYTNFEQYK